MYLEKNYFFTCGCERCSCTNNSSSFDQYVEAIRCRDRDCKGFVIRREAGAGEYLCDGCGARYGPDDVAGVEQLVIKRQEEIEGTNVESEKESRQRLASIQVCILY